MIELTNKITTAIFDIPTLPGQLKAFKSAVSDIALELKPKFEAAGISTDLFHNHNEEADFQLNHFRYPLIQFQTHEGKAAITGINSGAKAVEILLDYKPSKINFARKTHPYVLSNKLEAENTILLLPEPVSYKINYWIALNEVNQEKWNKSTDMIKRVELLNRCITGHILSFVKELAPTIETEKISSFIEDIYQKRTVKMHHIQKSCFDVRFKSNVSLPDRIGLGISPSIGFGKIRHLNYDDDV